MRVIKIRKQVNMYATTTTIIPRLKVTNSHK